MRSRRRRLPAGASRRPVPVGEGRGGQQVGRIGRGRPARATPCSASSGDRRRRGVGSRFGGVLMGPLGVANSEKTTKFILWPA